MVNIFGLLYREKGRKWRGERGKGGSATLVVTILEGNIVTLQTRNLVDKFLRVLGY